MSRLGRAPSVAARAALAALAVLCAGTATGTETPEGARIEIPAPQLGMRPLPVLVYTPPKSAPEPRPAVILLHGCGGVGRYPAKAGRAAGWVHVDTRADKARWRG